MNEIGEVLWHSLKENGEINFYDVMWPDGKIETDIPTKLLEKVADSDSNVDEHNEHGVDGHEEDLLYSKRKYKK